MNLAEKLLALELEGFYVEEGVLSPAEAARLCQSTEDTLDQGPVYGSNFLNHDQSLAPHLADERIVEVVRAIHGEGARIIANSGNLRDPNPGAAPRAPGGLHVDWPWGQSGASHIGGSLPDVVINITTFWMLTDFTRANGATVVAPGTHKSRHNPNGDPALKRARPTEFTVEAPAGSVLVFDGRLWHDGGVNRSSSRRVFWGVNYGPWWLNCHARRPHSVEHRLQAEAGHTPAGHWPYLKGAIFDSLPAQVKPLLRHWVDREWIMTKAEAEASVGDTSYFM